MAIPSHLPKYNEFLNPFFQALHDQIAVNSGPDRFSTIFIHYARCDTLRCTRDWQKYSYHCQKSDGELMVRWDNKHHWKDLATYPYHKHEGGKVLLFSQGDHCRCYG